MDDRMMDLEVRDLERQCREALERVERQRALLDHMPPEKRFEAEYALDMQEWHARRGLEEVREYHRWSNRHAAYQEHRPGDGE